MKTLTKNRLVLPDLLKGLAVILMVQVHLTEIFANQIFYDGLAGKISLFLGGPPAAPLFMAVMGYFIARKRQTGLQLVKRGVLLILLGFALNIGLNAHLLIRMWMGQFQHLSPFTYIFGVDILFLAGLSLISIALIRKLAQERIVIWLLFILLFAVANPFLPVSFASQPSFSYFIAYFWGYYHWSYFPVFPWMVYPLAGYVFYLLQKNQVMPVLNDQKKWLVFGLLSLVLLVTFQFAFSITTHLQAYYHHEPLYVIWTLGFLLWWLLLWYFIEKLSGANQLFQFVRFLGINVTAFYVAQWLLIGNLGTLLYKTQGPLLLAVWLVAVILFSSLLVVAYRKIKG